MSQDASTDVEAFLDHYFASLPVNATFTGVHTHDARLPDWRPEARAADVATMRALHTRLARAVPTDESPQDLATNPALLDATLAAASLDVRIAEAGSAHGVTHNAALWTGEAIFGVVSLLLRGGIAPVARADAIAARLAAIPEFLGAMPESLAPAIPARWTHRAISECTTAESFFAGGLARWLEESPHAAGIGMPARDRILNAASGAVAAFTTVRELLAAHPAAPDSSIAAGADFLNTLLRRGHFIDEDAHALLVQAEAELAEARAALEEHAAPRGGWPAAQAAIAADHPSPGGFMDAFHKRWQDVHDAVTAADAVTWPDWPIRYVPIPGWARDAAPQLYWLFYRSPAPFDTGVPVEYFVTPLDGLTDAERDARLAAWNHAQITLNHVVHHGGVGHHVQNWHAMHQRRSRIGTIAAVDTACRIGLLQGGSMAEGWACYATQLVEELGLLTENERLAERHTRVRLAMRAVADLRLHLGLDTPEAIEARFARETGMPAAAARAEVTKCSMFPATASMYWIGTRGLLDLREATRAAEGATFSLRRFHDRVLGYGSIPVPLLARMLAPTS